MGVISNLMFAVGFQIRDKALKDTEKQVEKTKQKVIAFGAVGAAALAGFGIAAGKAAADFGNAMTNIQMATGATNEQMEETRDIATNLYNQNFGENWADLGGAISAVQQVTALAGEDLERATRNALLMRDAFGYDVAESVETADTMMRQFGITSDEAFNLLAQGSQNGLNKSGDLLDTANEYSNQFKSLGFTVEEMFDTFAAGSENGAFNLDKVGDAIKEFNIRAKDGSEPTIEAFQMLGLNADQMMQTFAAGGPEAKEAFGQVISMISDIEDPVAKNTVGVALMGSQFEDLEAEVISAMGGARQQFDMTQATMEDLNQVKLDSPGQAFQVIGRQLNTSLLIPFGDRLLPYLQQFSTWITDNQSTIVAVGGTIANTLGGAVSGLANGIEWVINNFETLQPFLIGAGVTIGVLLIPALISGAAAGWAFIAPWLPFIAIAIGVGAAIAGLILIFKNWGAISDWLGAKWSEFRNWIKELFTGVVDFFSGIDLFEVGKDLVMGLINGIGAMKDMAIEKVKDVAGGIKDGITDFLGIKSPSRVMMEVGYDTGAGLAEGISGTQKMVMGASENLADSAVTTADRPATAAAAGVRSSRRQEIVFIIRGDGSTGKAALPTNQMDQIKAAMAEVLESTLRRLGLDDDPDLDVMVNG